MSTWLRFCTGVLMLAIAFSTYYALVYLPGQRFEDDRIQRSARQINLSDCFTTSDNLYNANWNASCKRLDLENDCILPRVDADRWDTMKNDARAECLRRYPPQ